MLDLPTWTAYQRALGRRALQRSPHARHRTPGALTALDAGITAMLDFSHNARSAAHSDAALRGLASTGIRGVHASMRRTPGARNFGK